MRCAIAMTILALSFLAALLLVDNGAVEDEVPPSPDVQSRAVRPPRVHATSRPTTFAPGTTRRAVSAAGSPLIVRLEGEDARAYQILLVGERTTGGVRTRTYKRVPGSARVDLGRVGPGRMRLLLEPRHGGRAVERELELVAAPGVPPEPIELVFAVPRTVEIEVVLERPDGGVPLQAWMVFLDSMSYPSFTRMIVPTEGATFRIPFVVPGRYWVQGHGDSLGRNEMIEVRPSPDRQRFVVKLKR